ncbi:membrane protein [Secundilactobacillus silagincola]|uniref:Membrane protein n=1 Tax=Secundilactobacillus silagincola TaxID=1714681 RepID=A0A1Z5J2H4_9LACO|nr:alpha/beta hydrolase [Secundilactobacillus silagincola]GAX07921.1 membrane protein [Secundilactobacillus silagincola]
MREEITFKRNGLTLSGHLFTPASFNADEEYPAIIVQGSLTSVKEQMADAYAVKFASQGFIALDFDYAHYGQSEGQPRQLEDAEEKLKDLHAAVDYLEGLEFVYGIGMVGVCTSASNGVYLVASDSRIKAFATIAGMIVKPAMYRSIMGETGILRRLEAAKKARQKFEATGEGTLIAAYSETDETACNYNPTSGAYDYYTNSKRGNVPTYRNAFDVSSWGSWLTLNPLSQAAKIKTPTIVVESDGCAFPDNAKELYETVKGPKELVWSDGMHFDYYDSDKQMDNAVANIKRFFKAYI